MNANQPTTSTLQFLHTVSQKISEKKPLPELLTEIMESSKILMQAEASSLLLYDKEQDKLTFQVATGDKGKLIQQYSLDTGEGIAGWVAQHREPLLIEDCYQDPRFNPDYDKKSNFKTHTMLCVPMVRKEQLIGVLQVINKQDNAIFTEDDLSVFETLASQCAIAIENYQLIQKQIETETLEHELEIARQIQQNALPESLPPFTDLDIAAVLSPAKQVGGDYYNILQINDEQTLLLIADVSGKSVSAALIVSTVDACLNCYLKTEPDEFDLKSFVEILNRVLIDTTTPMQFVTCWFGLYDHKSGTLTSVNAGHNPPYFFKKDSEEEQHLNKGGILLGVHEVPYEVEENPMHSDDLIVFYTDGVTESWNVHNEDYGDDRLIVTIKNNRHGTAQDVLTAIQTDVNRHVGDAPQSDDFTCIIIKKK